MRKLKTAFVAAILLGSASILFTACSGCNSKVDTTVNDATGTMNDAADAAGDAAGDAANSMDDAAGDAANAANDAAGDAPDTMETGGADLSFSEGSWSWNLQQYMDGGSGSQEFVLDQIAFEGEEVSAEGKAQLDDLAALLKAHPDMNVEIHGHTKEAANAIGKTKKKGTSKARALWVQAKLALRGVSGKQMKARGIGDDSLLTGVAGDDASQQRIAVVFTK